MTGFPRCVSLIPKAIITDFVVFLDREKVRKRVYHILSAIRIVKNRFVIFFVANIFCLPLSWRRKWIIYPLPTALPCGLLGKTTGIWNKVVNAVVVLGGLLEFTIAFILDVVGLYRWTCTFSQGAIKVLSCTLGCILYNLFKRFRNQPFRLRGNICFFTFAL